MRFPRFLSLKLALIGVILGGAAFAEQASAQPAFGTVGPVSQNESVIKGYFDLMQSRKLTRYRFDANLAKDTDPYEVNMVTMMVRQAKAHGIVLKPVLEVPFQWGDRTDSGKYPKGDAQALYSQGYNRVYNFVKTFRNDITDYELGNELNLLVKGANGAPLFGKGFTAAEFDTPAMNDWAQVLRGESDAIDKVNQENGTHIRKVLNTTSTMFGFLNFMTSKGVKFDVISYHYYEHLGTDPNFYWGYFNLFYELSRFNKPVQFNEINCAEIYDTTYQNVWAGNLTENCNKSFNNTLHYLTAQKYINIEDIDAYELIDEPNKAGAEGRFGVTFNARSLKMNMLTIAFYAGATLTDDEKGFITRRGFPNIQR